MPTDSRTRSSVTPVVALLLGVSCWWVVDAGWMISERGVADVGQQADTASPGR